MERLKKEFTVETIIEAGVSETKKGASDFIAEIDSIVEKLIEKLKVDEKATLGKYITIEKTHKEAREGRNPLTGEAVSIDAKDSIKIKATGQAKGLV